MPARKKAVQPQYRRVGVCHNCGAPYACLVNASVLVGGVAYPSIVASCTCVRMDFDAMSVQQAAQQEERP